MQPAAQAAGCFCCPADGELAHRTTDNENRQEVRRTDGCMVPKGRKDPRGRHRDSDGPRPAESRPQRSSVLPRIGAGVGGYWRRCVFPLGTCSAKQASVRSNGAGPHPFSAPAPKDHETCTTQSLHLRQRGCLGIWEPFFVQFHRPLSHHALEKCRNMAIFTAIDCICK